MMKRTASDLGREPEKNDFESNVLAITYDDVLPRSDDSKLGNGDNA